MGKDSNLIKELQQVSSVNEIKIINACGKFVFENRVLGERSFSYDADSKIMVGTETGNGELFGEFSEWRHEKLDFSESNTMDNDPPKTEQDGVKTWVFYNETDEEKDERLYKEFSEEIVKDRNQFVDLRDAIEAHFQEKGYLTKPAFCRVKELINYNVLPEFMDRVFIVDIPALVAQIVRFGGLAQQNVSKNAHYFVVWDNNERVIKQMLNYQADGSGTVFITPFQVMDALAGAKQFSKEKQEMLDLDREEKKILDEIEQLKEKIREIKEKK